MQDLILGGVRSGKSRLTERLARASGLEVIYSKLHFHGMSAYEIAKHSGNGALLAALGYKEADL